MDEVTTNEYHESSIMYQISYNTVANTVTEYTFDSTVYSAIPVHGPNGPTHVEY